MRNFGGRSGVVMPAEPRTQAAFARHGITTNPCDGIESFTGSDGTLGTTTTDLAWTNFSTDDASLDIVSNQLVASYVSPFAGYPVARCECAPTSPNQFAQFLWVAEPPDIGASSTDMVVGLRIEGGASNFYLDATGSAWFEFVWQGDGAGGLDITTIVYDDDGTEHTGAADFNVIPGQGVEGATFRCEANGDTGVMRVLRNGVEIYSDTNAFLTPSNPSGLYTGFVPQAFYTDPPFEMIFDDWECGNL